MVLPKPTGSFATSIMDLEWHSETSNSSILASLFYPSTGSSNNYSSWFPDSSYYPSYGYYMGIPKIVSWPLFYWFAGGAKMWATRKDPLVDNSTKLPLLIFSHGLGGIRTTYSTICTELASHGCIIVALEHRRDGSASMTIEQNNDITKPERKVRIYQPPLIKGQEHSFRHDQLEWRKREVMETLNLFTKSEKNAEIIMGDKELLEQLRNSIDMERIAIVGHSFGAATGILTSHHDQRLKAVIALDPWLYALPKEVEIKTPVLIISSETFNWPGNNDLVAQLSDSCQLSKKVVISGSAHMDQSDIPLIIPSFLMGRFRRGADSVSGKEIQMKSPLEVMEINLNLVVSFLRENKIIS